MSINKSKGNMYPDVKTWNGMYGICSHSCIYCYNRLHWQRWGKMRLNERALKDNLGYGDFYFVGSSCDMFADNIPKEWIIRVLEHCRRFDNKYLFQSKNPKRFEEFKGHFPENSIYGTTIETNKLHSVMRTNVPKPSDRFQAMCIFQTYDFVNDMMVSIEPIMDFDVDVLINWICNIKPKYVSIGADSGGNKLPEPSKEKIEALIKESKKITQVKIKDNLKRLTGVKSYNLQ